MNEFQTVAFLLLWIVIVVEGVLIFFLYRHVGLIYTGKMDGLPVGSRVPSFKATTANGVSLSFEDMLLSDTNLFVFGSFTCKPCHNLLYNAELNAFLAVQPISSYFLYSSDNGVNSAEQEKDLAFQLLSVNQNLFSEFMVSGTPFIYIIDKNGAVLMRGFISGPQNLMHLCQQYASSTPPNQNLPRVLTTQQMKS